MLHHAAASAIQKAWRSHIHTRTTWYTDAYLAKKAMYRCVVRRTFIYSGKHRLYEGSGDRQRLWIEYHPDKPDILHVRAHYTDSYAVFDAEHARMRYTIFKIYEASKEIRAIRSMEVEGMRHGSCLEYIQGFYGEDKAEFIQPGVPSFDTDFTLVMNEEATEFPSMYDTLPLVLGLPKDWSVHQTIVEDPSASIDVYANRFYAMLFGDPYVAHAAIVIQRAWRSHMHRTMRALLLKSTETEEPTLQFADLPRDVQALVFAFAGI